jgi:hypothetical protein
MKKMDEGWKDGMSSKKHHSPICVNPVYLRFE